MRGIDITRGIGRVLLKVEPVLGPGIARAQWGSCRALPQPVATGPGCSYTDTVPVRYRLNFNVYS